MAASPYAAPAARVADATGLISLVLMFTGASRAWFNASRAATAAH